MLLGHTGFVRVWASENGVEKVKKGLILRVVPLAIIVLLVSASPAIA
jgi:hypothetical protein